jgi:hypothetical protein
MEFGPTSLLRCDDPGSAFGADTAGLCTRIGNIAIGNPVSIALVSTGSIDGGDISAWFELV